MQRILWERLGEGLSRSRLSQWSPRLAGVDRKLVRRWVGIVVTIAMIASTVTMAIWPAPTSASNVNVLYNGGFEQGFSSQAGCGMVGNGWQCFTNGGAANYGFYDDQWERTVAEGKHSQLIEVNTKGIMVGDADRYAGIYQTVPVVAWAQYTLNLSGMIRTTELMGDKWRYRVEVGWTAGPAANWQWVTNWKDVGWDQYYERTDPKSFLSYSGPLMAESNYVTVYVRVWKKWGVGNQELDVNLDAIGLYGPTPYGHHAGPLFGEHGGIGGPVDGYGAYPSLPMPVDTGCGSNCGGYVEPAPPAYPVQPDYPAGGGCGTDCGGHGGGDMCSYTVRPGDTLSWVAQSMGVNMYDLAAANGIANPNLIYVGQVLVNPNCGAMDGGHGGQYGAGYGAEMPAGYGAEMPATYGPEMAVGAGYGADMPAGYSADMPAGYGAEMPASYGPGMAAGAGYGDMTTMPATSGPGYPAADGAGWDTPAAALPMGGNSYTVVAGDNLSQVAAAYGVSVRQMMQANGIQNPNIIFVGQLLVIP